MSVMMIVELLRRKRIGLRPVQVFRTVGLVALILVAVTCGIHLGGQESRWGGAVIVSDPNDAYLSDKMAVGYVIGFAGLCDGVSAKWIPCDGRLLEKQSYRELLEVIGPTYTPRSADASVFAVPDLRGMYRVEIVSPRGVIHVVYLGERTGGIDVLATRDARSVEAVQWLVKAK